VASLKQRIKIYGILVDLRTERC